MSEGELSWVKLFVFLLLLIMLGGVPVTFLLLSQSAMEDTLDEIDAVVGQESEAVVEEYTTVVDNEISTEITYKVDSVVEQNTIPTSFNNNFITHGNSRVTFDETLLSLKAQELFEDKCVQFYFVTVDTSDRDSADARSKAENSQKHIDDAYKVVLTVTDAGSFWFFGDSVSSFLSTESKEDLFNMFKGTYNVEEYVKQKPDPTPLYVALAGILVAVMSGVVARYKIKKREIDRELLSTPLEKIRTDTDDLVKKYTETT